MFIYIMEKKKKIWFCNMLLDKFHKLYAHVIIKLI